MASPDDQDAFERAMRQVDRLDAGTVRVAPPKRQREVEAATPEFESSELELPEFELTVWGDHQQGLRTGADPLNLRRLEMGDFPPELTLDLHHRGAEEARAEVRRGLRHARRSGLRVVRIVHGRGRRSVDGPVLKAALPTWLAQPPHGRSVLAFTTTGEFGAGGGATLVLLSKKR